MLASALIGFHSQSSFSTELSAYSSRCETKPSYLYKVVLEEFIRTLKNADVWNDHIGIFIYAGETADMALLNLVADQFNGVLKDGSSSSASAVTFFGGIGFLPNGTGGWIDHNITPSSLTTDHPTYTSSNNFIWEFCFTDTQETAWVLAAPGNSSNIGIRPIYGVSTAVTAGNSTADTISNTKSGFGFKGVFRDNSSDYVVNFDVLPTEKTLSRTVNGLPTSKLGIYRFGPSGLTYSVNGLSVWGIGAGTLPSSATKRAALASAVGRMMRRLGVEELRPSAEVIEPPNAFSASSVTSVTPSGLIVMQQAPPPVNNSVAAGSYSYYPLNASASTQHAALVSTEWTNGTCWVWTWGSRSTEFNKRDNANLSTPAITTTVDGFKYSCRMEYTTVEKAIGADLAMLSAHMGLPATNTAGTGYLDVARQYGFPTDTDTFWVDWDTANADPLTYFTDTPTNGNNSHLVMVDRILSPKSGARLCDMSATKAPGILLDYEVADYRSEAQTLEVIQKYADILHAGGRKLFLYLNPLNSGNAVKAGINGNTLNDILSYVDYLSIVAWPNNVEKNVATSLTNQINLLDGPNHVLPVDYSKLIVTVGIGPYRGELTNADAQTVRNFITNYGMAGVNFWRFYGLPGGSISRQYNQIIATVLGLPTS